MSTKILNSLIRRTLESIYRRVAVRGNVQLGRGVHVGPGSVLWAPRSLDIGNSVYIGKYVTIQADGTIGDGALIANNVGIVGRSDHDIKDVGKLISRARWVGNDPVALSQPLHIGPDVWIGYGAIVLSGVEIGASSIIGSGAVVTASVPANSVAVGNPARVIGKRFASEAELHAHWQELARQGVRGLPDGSRFDRRATP